MPPLSIKVPAINSICEFKNSEDLGKAKPKEASVTMFIAAFISSSPSSFNILTVNSFPAALKPSLVAMFFNLPENMSFIFLPPTPLKN